MSLHFIHRHRDDRCLASGAAIRHPVTQVRITSEFIDAAVCIGGNVLTQHGESCWRIRGVGWISGGDSAYSASFIVENLDHFEIRNEEDFFVLVLYRRLS